MSLQYILNTKIFIVSMRISSTICKINITPTYYIGFLIIFSKFGQFEWKDANVLTMLNSGLDGRSQIWLVRLTSNIYVVGVICPSQIE